jgi:peptidoglycan L-alanyl-D-glutamate endopeptidase CwlK
MRSLLDADDRLRSLFSAAKTLYEAATPGVEIVVTCTFRSPQEQTTLYAQGRTTPGPIVTHCDGVNTPSQHNRYPSRAIDFAVLLHGKVSWHDADYAGFGHACAAQGLVWGGDWPHFTDAPHVELPATV